MTDENRDTERLWPQFTVIWLVAVVAFWAMFHYGGGPPGWRSLGIATVVATVYCAGFGWWAHTAQWDEFLERRRRSRSRHGTRR